MNLASTSQATAPPNRSANSDTLCRQADRIFRASFKKFEHTVSKYSHDDHRDFSSTTLEDVYKAAKAVETQLEARQCLRNMRRIQPFLEGLEAYARVVEVLCNGTPYLPWIWAPIKLMLQLSTDYISAFDKLISAYGQIAENLPRFDRLAATFRSSPDFQRVLAVVYSDVLEFHRRAYNFMKKGGWKCFFNSSWGRFDSRFRCILDSLQRHADLVDREANAFAISEMMEWRQEAMREASREDKDRLNAQLTSVLSWLEPEDTLKGSNQDDIYDRLVEECCPGTSEWLVKNDKIRSWLGHHHKTPALWLKGKPGSGKSTLCAILTRFLRSTGQYTVLFHFYSYRSSARHPSNEILAGLIGQLLRQHQRLAAYVYTDFVSKGTVCSLRTLKEILSNLLTQTHQTRILVDGIDECVDHVATGLGISNPVKEVFKDVVSLADSQACKLLVFSRDIPQVGSVLTNKAALSLDDEDDAVKHAIHVYVQKRLEDFPQKTDTFRPNEATMQDLQNNLVSKSQGMFLWIRLVLDHIEEEVLTLHDMKQAVADIPAGLEAIYFRIISQIQRLSPQTQERAIRILEWMSGAKRTLRTFELQDAVSFSQGFEKLTDTTKLPEAVLHFCKPLIHISNDRLVTFIHFTVQEYLTKSVSGPFLEPLRMQRTISFTCIAYLNFSMSLIDADTKQEERTIQVAKGFHTLHLYILDNWLDHLLEYISAHKGLGPSTDSGHLHQQLDTFTDFVQRYESQSENASISSQGVIGLSPYNAVASDRSLMYLERYPRLRSILSRAKIFRKSKREHFAVDSQDAVFDDPTPLSKTLDSYNDRVRILLDSSSFPGVTAAQLAEFKTNHGLYMFVCRYPGCTHSSDGFATDRLRLDHERQHAPPLICKEAGCFYGLSFASVNALNRHMRSYHSVGPPPIPKNIRRIGGSGNIQNGRHSLSPNEYPDDPALSALDGARHAHSLVDKSNTPQPNQHIPSWELQQQQLLTQQRLQQQTPQQNLSPGQGQNAQHAQTAMLKARHTIQQSGVPLGQNPQGYLQALAQRYYQQSTLQAQAGQAHQNDQPNPITSMPPQNPGMIQGTNIYNMNLNQLKREFAQRKNALLSQFGVTQNIPPGYLQQMRQLEATIQGQERLLLAQMAGQDQGIQDDISKIRNVAQNPQTVATFPRFQQMLQTRQKQQQQQHSMQQQQQNIGGRMLQDSINDNVPRPSATG